VLSHPAPENLIRSAQILLPGVGIKLFHEHTAAHGFAGGVAQKGGLAGLAVSVHEVSRGLYCGGIIVDIEGIRPEPACHRTVHTARADR